MQSSQPPAGRPPPKLPGFWVAQFVLEVVVAALLVRGSLATHTPGGRLFAAIIVAIVLANLLLALMGHRRARTALTSRGREDRRTGRTLEPGLHPPWPMGSLGRPAKWIGGANVPSPMGRLNATWPLATLELSGAALRLAVTPGRLFGVKPLSAGPSAVELVFPVRRRLGPVGIALRPPGVPDSYFWTRRQTEVLAALAAAGFPVSWEEQRPRTW
jgi:hypothetical protein